MRFAKWGVVLLGLIVFSAGSLPAQENAATGEESKTVAAPQDDEIVTSPEQNKIVLGLAYGAFRPSSSGVRDSYPDGWTRLSLTTFQPVISRHWRFVAESGRLALDGDTDVTLVPITAGVSRGLADKRSFQPYVALRTGPYIGRLRPSVGDSSTKMGWSANSALGVVYKRRFFLEARYDYFSPLSDTNFSGFSISIGTRIMDIRL